MKSRTRRLALAVTTTLPSKSGFVWWPAEFDVPEHMTDDQGLDLVHATLVEDRLIRLTKIEVEGPPHDRRVAKRSEFILGINAILTITPLHIRIAEAEG